MDGKHVAHTQTLSLFLTHTHSRALSLTHARTHTLSISLSFSLSLSHAHTTLTMSLSITQTQAVMQSVLLQPFALNSTFSIVGVSGAKPSQVTLQGCLAHKKQPLP